MSKFLKFGIGILIFVVVMFIGVIGANLYVKYSTKNDIMDCNVKCGGADCIIVLGAGIWGDEPSPMLADRLNKAIDLYKEGVAPKIIMTGDHGKKYYNEVKVMKNFAIDRGVPSEDIFMDHAGFSTYDSLYRARDVFGAKRVVIVSQEYHLYRSLYIAKKLGMEAVGVPTVHRNYAGDNIREIREVVARFKDFVKCIFLPKPKFLGEKIPLNQSGDVT